MNDLLLKLEKLGLSSYEAKALVALMQRHPANGYEVSKLAKIPPSKIYETLQRLKNKGVIITDD
jgi:HTH-type transcriptional regulator, sugar sensing transcriptional regulator